MQANGTPVVAEVRKPKISIVIDEERYDIIFLLSRLKALIDYNLADSRIATKRWSFLLTDFCFS